MKMTPKQARAYQEWKDLCRSISSATPVIQNESEVLKKQRIQKLANDTVAFCRYYFPHYMDSDFAWFHKRAAKNIIKDPNIFAILEWPREHAKSVFANIMIPMQLYALHQLTGMVTVSANNDKAKELLADIQAELISNRRWINDYGNLAQHGDWRDGKFTTTDGIGFWAFGRGQSPRGIRKAALRPNYAVVDDIDDKTIVRNSLRVKDAVYWVLEDLYGAIGIKAGRLLIAGNRIHPQSILAHLVGDTEPEQPKRKGITHIKVYAIENPKTHKKADIITGGTPAWKERYSIKELQAKMNKMGHRASRREYFHEHHEEGLVFQNEWIQFVDPLPYSKYDAIVVYTDPSFKDTKKNDFKAVVMLGKRGVYLDILKVWLRQGSVTAMVQTNYDWWEELENRARYYMEANFLQDILLDDFAEEGKNRGSQMPIRPDKRSKGNKQMRIENLEPLFQRGIIRFNKKERSSNDMQMFIQQLLGFPYGHDDGPDALEGAVWLLQKIRRASNTFIKTGRYKRRSKRD